MTGLFSITINVITRLDRVIQGVASVVMDPRVEPEDDSLIGVMALRCDSASVEPYLAFITDMTGSLSTTIIVITRRDRVIQSGASVVIDPRVEPEDDSFIGVRAFRCDSASVEP